MASKYLAVILCSMAFINCQTASAETVATVGELDVIQAETLVLKAKAKREEERNNLAKFQTVGGDSDGSLPTIEKIVNGKVTFTYPGGISVTGKTSETISGGFKVGKIDADTGKVELVKAGNRFIVGFASAVSRAPGSIQAQPFGTVPR